PELVALLSGSGAPEAAWAYMRAFELPDSKLRDLGPYLDSRAMTGLSWIFYREQGMSEVRWSDRWTLGAALRYLVSRRIKFRSGISLDDPPPTVDDMPALKAALEGWLDRP